MTNQPANKSILISYLAIRKAIGFLAIGITIIVPVGALIFDNCQEIQSSISAYYHTIMRDIFVGTLCAVALFLITYRGYDKDYIWSRIAGVSALGIAFFPTSVGLPHTLCIPSDIDMAWLGIVHYISALTFFLMLARLSYKQFTKCADNPSPQKLNRNKVYRITAVIMLICVGLIGVYGFFLRPNFPELVNYSIVFWLEVIALWAFGISWLIKGELLMKDIEH